MKLRNLLLTAALLLAVPASAQTSLVNQPVPTNCSGTVATGATAVTAIAVQKVQNGFLLQNLDTTEPLWWSVTGVAVASGSGSFVLGADTATTFAVANSFITPQRFSLGGALSVVAATAGHKFSCIYW